MQRVALLLATTLAAVVPAAAQVSHPKKATTYLASLVPAYQPCAGYTTSHEAPGNYPACSPTLPVGSGVNVEFDVNGHCTVKLKTGGIIKVRCSHIVDQATSAGYDGSLALDVRLRVTDTNCIPAGACTAADLSLSDLGSAVPVACVNGACNAQVAVASILPGGNTTNAEVHGVTLLQPDGATPFAVDGLYVPGPGPTTGHPKMAKKFYASLVTAYEDCNATTTPPAHDAPLAAPACQPPVLSSSASGALVFGPDGYCSVQYKVVTNRFTLVPDVELLVKCTDIREGGVTPFSGTLYSTAVMRLTDENCFAPGPCTVVDQPINVLVPCGTAASPVRKPGTCLLKTTVNTETAGTLAPGSIVQFLGEWSTAPEMPATFLWDPVGNNPFVTPGLYVP